MITLELEALNVKQSYVLKYWRETVSPCEGMSTELLLETILNYAFEREMQEEGFKKWLSAGGQYK